MPALLTHSILYKLLLMGHFFLKCAIFLFCLFKFIYLYDTYSMQLLVATLHTLGLIRSVNTKKLKTNTQQPNTKLLRPAMASFVISRRALLALWPVPWGRESCFQALVKTSRAYVHFLCGCPTHYASWVHVSAILLSILFISERKIFLYWKVLLNTTM